MPLIDIVDAFKKAVPHWDPAKHPRGRDGKFLEVGDLVSAFLNKEALEPETVGRVHASYLAPDGRMFIGVESYGYVRWYRPKQLEHIKVKATLKGGKEKTPDLPLPAVDEQYDEVFWQNDDGIINPPGVVQEAIDDDSAPDLTIKKADLDGEFLAEIGLADYKPAPSSVPQTDEVVIPANKTPDDMLRMIATSYDNKLKAGSIGPYDYSDDGPSAWHKDLEDMLADPEFKSAHEKLSKLMTAAKLGGKQRKRYNSILAQKHGGHQAASFTPAAPDPDDELVVVQDAVPDPGYPIPAPPDPNPEQTLQDVAKGADLEEIKPAGKDDDSPSTEDLPYDESLVDPDLKEMFSKPLEKGVFTGVEKAAQGGDPSDPQGAVWTPVESESAKAALYEYGGSSAIPAMPEVIGYVVPGTDADWIDTYTADLNGPGVMPNGMAAKDWLVSVAQGSGNSAPSAVQVLLNAWQNGTHGVTGKDLHNAKIKPMAYAAVDPGATIDPTPAPVPGKPVDWEVWNYIADETPPNAMIYKHPQGSYIIADPVSGQLIKYKPDGKKASTSATLTKLVHGHGQWANIGTGPSALLADLEISGPVPGPAVADKPEVAPAVLAKPISIDKSQDEVLKLLKTSMHNKGLGGTWDDVNTQFDELLSLASYDDALPKLNALMTAAKLGGKQRKRYKDALAAKYGVGPTVIPKGKGSGISGPDSWPAIVPSSGNANTPADVVGPTKGNQLVNPPNLGPGNAKASIQEQLSKRLKGKATLKQLTDSILDSEFQFPAEHRKIATQAQKYGKTGGAPTGMKLGKTHHGQWMLVASGSPASGYKETIPNPTAADWERAMLELVATSLIGQWAGTSNDTNARALAMQLAAEEEFGLRDTYDWPMGSSLKADTTKELNKHRALYRTFLREMYNNTQAWAKANGVKRVRLRRGSGVYSGPKGSTANAKLRPMSSFSTNMSTAQGFGSNLVEAYIPIEWVIGNAATGYGCQSEYEWVILGGTHKVKVI